MTSRITVPNVELDMWRHTCRRSIAYGTTSGEPDGEVMKEVNNIAIADEEIECVLK